MDPRWPERMPDDWDDAELPAPPDAEGGPPEWTFTWPADEDLAARAAAALRRDPLVLGRRLEILVQNGVVILLGELDSAQARAAAGSRAWQVPGVADVCNRVTVTGTERGAG